LSTKRPELQVALQAVSIGRRLGESDVLSFRVTEVMRDDISYGAEFRVNRAHKVVIDMAGVSTEGAAYNPHDGEIGVCRRVRRMGPIK